MSNLIDRNSLLKSLEKFAPEKRDALVEMLIKKEPTADAVPVIRCKECKYFELDHIEKVMSTTLIVAHEICTRWGNGCKTSPDGYCYMAERKEE